MDEGSFILSERLLVLTGHAIHEADASGQTRKMKEEATSSQLAAWAGCRRPSLEEGSMILCGLDL